MKISLPFAVLGLSALVRAIPLPAASAFDLSPRDIMVEDLVIRTPTGHNTPGTSHDPLPDASVPPTSVGHPPTPSPPVAPGGVTEQGLAQIKTESLERIKDHNQHAEVAAADAENHASTGFNLRKGIDSDRGKHRTQLKNIAGSTTPAKLHKAFTKADELNKGLHEQTGEALKAELARNLAREQKEFHEREAAAATAISKAADVQTTQLRRPIPPASEEPPAKKRKT